MPDTQVVRLRDPAELIAAIPYLIGFHPSDCFVVCGLAAESPVLHMRVDADAGSQPAALARMFASHLQRARAESLILVGYGATAAGTISQVADAMHSGPLVVLDVLTVLDGRWRSLLCESAACCPPGGSPIPVAEQLPVVAQLVAAGRVARRDRSELICDVEADAKRQTDVAAHIVRIAELTPLPAAGLLQQWLDVGTAIGAGSELPSASVSAQLLHGLRNVRVRDDLMGEIARDPIGLEPLLTWLASSCPTHEAAPIFTLTALPAWLRGDGARASQLLELALNADPDYRLAQLLDLGLSAGLPPAEIAAICRSTGAGADEDAPAAAS